ncbi:hypothetical protein BH24DEI2_BH24DEI2_26280 [soil metagenome]
MENKDGTIITASTTESLTRVSSDNGLFEAARERQKALMRAGKRL